MKSELIEKKEINNSEEDFDEMEEDDNKDELIEKKKKSKKKESKSSNHNLLKFLIANIVIIVILFAFYLYVEEDEHLNINNNQSIEDNTKENVINLPDMNFKLNKIINNTDIYELSKNKIVKFPIQSIDQFPSGNIITADWIRINIYDKDYNLLQKIDVFKAEPDSYYKKDQKKIYKVQIQDENNFALCGNDGSLKYYTKQDKEFVLKQNIEKEGIVDLTFDSEGKIITGARDNSVKIFKKDEKGIYKIYRTRKFASSFQVKLFEKENILVSTDIFFIQFYNIKNNYELIDTLKQKSLYDPEKYDDDKFIVYTNNSLKVVSFKEIKVVKTIDIGFQAYVTKVLEDKGVILVAGCTRNSKGYEKSVFRVYKKDTFELLKSYDDIHGNSVKGIFILDNGLIATFGDDQDDGFPLKLWSLEL